MSTATASTLHVHPASQPRLRLIALLLASWGDTLPAFGSKVRGEAAPADRAPSRRDASERVDKLLLSLEHAADDQLHGEPDDRNVVSIFRHMNATRHPAYRLLERALGVLAVDNPYGCRLIIHTYVDAPDERFVVAAAHGLAFIAGGQPGVPVHAPRYELVRAMVQLNGLLPAGMDFPAAIREQEEGWETWLASVKRAKNDKQQRSASYRAAVRQRNRLVEELRGYGWSQQEIGRKLGLSQQVVSKILTPGDDAA